MKFEKAIQNMIETKENDMLGITVENEEELTKVIEALENKGYQLEMSIGYEMLSVSQ